jgi:hypothetical protein
VHRAQERSPRQEIDPSAPQLARARAGQNEAGRPSFFDQSVHDVQEFGCLLHLVDDNDLGLAIAGNEFAQSFRPDRLLTLNLRRQKVHVQTTWKAGLEPGRFAGTSPMSAEGGPDLIWLAAGRCCLGPAASPVPGGIPPGRPAPRVSARMMAMAIPKPT